MYHHEHKPFAIMNVLISLTFILVYNKVQVLFYLLFIFPFASSQLTLKETNEAKHRIKLI